MRKEDRVEVKKETNILFGVCREKNSSKIPEKVITKNISGGGMCITSNTEVKKGTVLAAEIVLNTEGMQKFRAYCETLWSRKSDDGYEAGVQFIGVKPSEEEQLKKYLENLIYN